MQSDKPLSRRGGRRREVMIGDVATVALRAAISPDHLAWIQARARHHGQSVSWVVRALIAHDMAHGPDMPAGLLEDAGATITD